MLPPLFSLAGRRALVTGSSRGIGAAIAAALAEAGAAIALHCAGHEPATEGNAHMIRVDLSDDDAARRVFDEAISLLGGIDILVLNASLQTKKNWTDFNRADIDAHYAVNYRASFELLQLAAPGMMERGWGRILTIGSVQEKKPHPEMLVYSSFKHAQTGLVLGLGGQLAPRGVTINSLAPGVIATDRNAAALSDPDYAGKVRSAIPAGFFGEPADCAGAALFLCSEAGRYITCQNLFVDGGLGRA
jgi:glucose 1-dehydrogenase